MMPRRSFIIAFLIFLMMVLLAPAPAQTPQGVPVASIDTHLLELGTLIAGEKRSLDLRIRNEGTGELKILDIQASCGCTTIKKPQGSIRPGGSGIIEMEFNSAGMSGTVEKHVQITTNDPKNPEVTISFRSNIKPVLEVVKYRSNIFLGTKKLGTSSIETIRIVNLSSETLKIERLFSVSKGLEANTAQTALAPAETLLVKLTVTPEKQGYFIGTFYLNTNHKYSPVLPFKVTLNVK